MAEERTNGRLASLDVARGFDMLWIMGLSGLVIKVCAALGYGPETAVAAQMEHPFWLGLHFQDLIFPTFIFIAGISFPFSLAKQRERGVTTAATLRKIARRVITLILLGLVYNAILYNGPSNTVWGSVLARIGLAWGLAAALTVLVKGVRARVILSVAILLGYWALSIFAVAPDHPGADPLTMEGCFAGWVDRMLLPGKLTAPGLLSSQGILSTLPAIVTAMLGIFTGEYVRGKGCCGGVVEKWRVTVVEKWGEGEWKSLVMLVASVLLVAAGLFVAYGCGPYSFPLIKKLWSTSFTLVCAGYALALFTVCYFLIDVKGWWRHYLFFQVIGLNAITIYLAQTVVGVRQTKEMLFKWISTFFPAGWDAVVLQVGYIAVCWALLYFLHRRKIYLKV